MLADVNLTSVNTVSVAGRGQSKPSNVLPGSLLAVLPLPEYEFCFTKIKSRASHGAGCTNIWSIADIKKRENAPAFTYCARNLTRQIIKEFLNTVEETLRAWAIICSSRTAKALLQLTQKPFLFVIKIYRGFYHYPTKQIASTATPY